MRYSAGLVVLASALLTVPGQAAPRQPQLEVYWIDVEGGAATLIVTPARESILVDAGNPGGRDAQRIHEVATRVAGLSQIDYLVVTHYHRDHFGGVAELAELMPVGALYERGLESAPEKERNDPALGPFRKARIRRRVVVKPGDQILLAQSPGVPLVDFRFLAASQRIAATEGAPQNAALCGGSTDKEQDTSDNANSLVMLLTQGPFRLLDTGDLTWNVEKQLVCPVDEVGKVDVFQASHHGLDQSNNPVLVRTLEPTVVVVDNGPRKGGQPGSFATFGSTPSVKAVYQLHRNLLAGASNTAPERIANAAENCSGDYIKLSVEPAARGYTLSVPSTRSRRSYKTKAS